ncbi:MAG: hypothetical protein AB8I08_09415, partial [Sandaracinaceae bacterium]
QPAPEPPTEPPSREGGRSIAALESLLSARHAEDLPNAETLSEHDQPAAALRHIATHHRRMVVRGRALSSLRHYGDAETRALLLQTLTDPDAHPTLVAAAARGSAGLTLDTDLRAALEQVRANDDPRITRAVDARLNAANPVPVGQSPVRQPTSEEALRGH